MKRRQFVGAALAGAASTGGCIGVLTGSEALELSASKATVSQSARSETGYEESAVEAVEMERGVTVAGQTRTVVATNWAARYDRSISVGPLVERRAATFVAFATPQAEVLGEPFNPVEELSTREILKQIQSRYENFSVGDRIDVRTETVLGVDADVETYEGSASFDGASLDVHIPITKVAHGSDFLVLVGVYPRALDGERERFSRLLGGVQHGE